MQPDNSSQVDLKGLIQLARTAYDQKRRKECLALIDAILKINPATNEARVLRSLIETDIQQALQRITSLTKNPRLKTDEDLRTNAFQTLQTVLDIDPDNKAANALLLELDRVGKRETSAAPADSKTQPKNEKRSERPGWTPPEVGPPETFPPSSTRPKNYWIRYAAVAVILLIVAAIAAHFGYVSSVLQWLGISGPKAPEGAGIIFLTLLQID